MGINKGYLKYSGLIVACIVLFGFASQYLYLDINRDELDSFQHFSLLPYGDIVGGKYFANNHIFFNLFQHTLSGVLSITTLHKVLNNLVLFRVVQLLFSLFTVLMCYKFARRFFDQRTADVAAILLVSCMPFLSYFTQLRGYNFSMLFGISLLYFSWKYIEQKQKKQLIAVGLLGFLLLYTVPSNIYYFASLSVAVALMWLNELLIKKVHWASEPSKMFLQLGGTLGLSLLITLWAYSPLFEQILSCSYINRVPKNRFYTLVELLPDLTVSFLSAKYLLLLLFAPGVYLMFKNKPDKKTEIWLWLLFIFLFGFVLSFIRNDFPFHRTYSVLIPIFSLLLAVPVIGFIRHRITEVSKKNFAIAAIYGYCILSGIFHYNYVQDKLEENFFAFKKDVSASYNFYHSKLYQPDQSAKTLASFYEKNPYPVLLVSGEIDHAISAAYLSKYKVPSYQTWAIKPNNKAKNKSEKTHFAVIRNTDESGLPENNKYAFRKMDYHKKFLKFELCLEYAEQFDASDHYYIVTSFEERFKKHYKQFLKKDFKLKRLSKTTSSYNVYLLSKKNKKTFTKKNKKKRSKM